MKITLTDSLPKQKLCKKTTSDISNFAKSTGAT